MNKTIVLNKIKTLLNIEVKLEQMKLENGTILEAEVFEAGAEVFVVTDEERVAVPVGEYTFEDGKILVVVEEGVIAEVKEAGEPEAVEEAAETPELEAEKPVKKIVESVSKEMHFSEEQMTFLMKFKEDILAELRAEKKPEVEVELEAVEPIKPNPELLVAQKEMHLYGQGGGKSLQSQVYQRISNFKKNKN